MSFCLRNYQDEAIDAVIRDWNNGVLNALVALPTGVGKTEVAIFLLKRVMKPGDRALFLAHRDELIQQPLGRFGKRWPEINLGIVKAERNDVDAQVILGSIQTVCRPNRLGKLLEAGPIDYVVYDEAHHSPTRTGKYVLDSLREANPELRHVGLTATPWRADGVGLVATYDRISYQMNIMKAIRDGWLVPVDGLQIETGVNLSGVKIARGDFVQSDLEDVLDAAGWHDLVTNAYIEHADGKQAIAYTPGVAGSKSLCQAFLERGVNAVHIDGGTPRDERREIVRDFRDRKIQVLTNCAIATEGFDAPSVECILLARPTRSHGLFTQLVGRGLRIFPGKERCLVLLFTTTGARILTLHSLGKGKQLKEAEKTAEETGIEGFSEPIPLFDEEAIDGVGLYARVVDLFGLSKNAWFRDGATFSLGLGEHEGYERALVILPPNGSDDWQLVGVGRSVTHTDAWGESKVKRGSWQVRSLAEAPDVEELMAMAVDVVERRAVPILSDKAKRWRKEPASDGQKRFARKWATATVVEGLTKGEAAQLITNGLALDAIRAQVVTCSESQGGKQ